MTKTFFPTAVFAALLIAGQSTASAADGAPRPVSAVGKSPQIQSQSLRIEFDKHTRSRVIARFNDREIPLGTFSASETVQGNESTWNDFVLDSEKHEHISDNFGGGEKLTLIGSSGTLRKNLSVSIYDEFPNLAVFDVTYT